MRRRRLADGITKLVSGDADIGESRLLPIAAIVGAALLYATLPQEFVVGHAAGAFNVARWIVPALTGLVLLALIGTLPNLPFVHLLDVEAERLKVTRRALFMAAVSLVTVANLASIVLLVHLLVNGAHANAGALLRAGIHMWCLNVLVFGLWFWQLDNGGPVARLTAGPQGRDFLFPQQATPELLQPDWRPHFLDYLYVSFTNATAFSPTDAMPLSRWSKMLMLVESAASLMLAVMVAARAVNILQ
ncbi:MAG: DUF1345 domain-containing protein [Actinobacteria bacterium]|nr:DUF1345 domain-containing protein [Actinomycetota bacterium]